MSLGRCLGAQTGRAVVLSVSCVGVDFLVAEKRKGNGLCKASRGSLEELPLFNAYFTSCAVALRYARFKITKMTAGDHSGQDDVRGEGCQGNLLEDVVKGVCPHQSIWSVDVPNSRSSVKCFYTTA